MQEADSKGAELMHKGKDDVLLDALLRYILPIFNKNNITDRKKQGKLEELVKKEKPELKPLGLIFLEDLIDSFLRNHANDKSPIKKIEKIEIPVFSEDHDGIKNDAEGEIRYSIDFQRIKNAKSNFRYSININYEENEAEEKLSVGIRLNNADDNYPLNKKTIKDNEKINGDNYSIIIKKEKDGKITARDNYSVSLVYENNYEEERLSIHYKSAIGAYLSRRQQALNDFSDRVPGKWVDVFPANMMGSVLGFTYLGQGYMALRDDLIGKTKKMVDIHESIHTPDEYETRILTDWIMSRPRIKYIK